MPDEICSTPSSASAPDVHFKIGGSEIIVVPPEWYKLLSRSRATLLVQEFQTADRRAGFAPLFFADPSRTTLIVMGVLLIGSLFVRDLWCRYLCPYGALLGLFGRAAPLKITRDPEVCTACEGCSDVCPSRLPVHEVIRVTSVECTGCLDCVVACPVSSCLEVRPPKRLGGERRVRPLAVVGIAALIWIVVLGGFRLAGHWHSVIPEEEHHLRLQELESPLYAHPGSR